MKRNDAKLFRETGQLDKLERLLAQKRDYAKRDRLKRPLKYLLKDAKVRARRKGLEFNITQEDLIIPNQCPILLIPIVLGGTKTDRNNSPSIDRIDNSKGYIKGNIRIISWRANQCKSDLSLEDVRRLFSYCFE